MLMTAGAGLFIGLAIVAVAAVIGLALQALADKASYALESRRLYAEKAARRARYERMLGLNRQSTK